MLKKRLHIVLAILLAITTSSTVWGQFVIDKESIEISEKFEKDAEEVEKELEDKFEKWDGPASGSSDQALILFSGFLKTSSCTLTPSSLKLKKLFIFLHRLKIDC